MSSHLCRNLKELLELSVQSVRLAGLAVFHPRQLKQSRLKLIVRLTCSAVIKGVVQKNTPFVVRIVMTKGILIGRA